MALERGLARDGHEAALKEPARSLAAARPELLQARHREAPLHDDAETRELHRPATVVVVGVPETGRCIGREGAALVDVPYEMPPSDWLSDEWIA